MMASMALTKTSKRTSFIFLTALLVLFSNIANAQSFPRPNCQKAPKAGAQDCGRKVRIAQNAGYYSSAQNADNIQQCQNLCLRRAPADTFGCNGFSFNSKTKVCALYDIVPPYTPDATSPITFSYASCFTCQICPQPLGQNILDVPQFETVKKLFGPWTSADYIKTSIVHPGFNSNSALFSTCGNGACPDGWNLYQVFNACNGTLYKVELDYKATYSARSGPSLSISTGDVSVYPFGRDLSNNVWQHFTSYFSGSYDTRKTIGALSFNLYDLAWASGGNYGIYIDNASIVPVNKNLTPPASAPQLIPNGGFETRKLGPWKVGRYPAENTSSVRQPGINSKYAFHATTAGFSSVNLDQPLAKLVVGAEYIASFDYNAPNTTYLTLSVGSVQSISKTACVNIAQCSGHVEWLLVARNENGKPANFTVSASFGDPYATVSSSITLDNISLKRLN